MPVPCLCGCGRAVPSITGRAKYHPDCRTRKRRAYDAQRDINASEIDRRFAEAKAALARARRAA